jgi:hypothetical protein
MEDFVDERGRLPVLLAVMHARHVLHVLFRAGLCGVAQAVLLLHRRGFVSSGDNRDVRKQEDNKNR